MDRGFTYVNNSTRYTNATAVRTNYNNWGNYDRDWYTRNPGAWYAAGWAAGSVWRPCTWSTAAAYGGYYSEPVYYDYGTNVTYQDNSVYINGASVGTSAEYYSQATTLATTGAAAQAPADADWLPLGVFALTPTTSPAKSEVTIQLALNKQGVIRGNYTVNASNQNLVVKGSVDQQSQRVAFTVGDDTTNVIETGLYNLTKDEAPCLIHYGSDRTEQWLLVRLQKSADGTN